MADCGEEDAYQARMAAVRSSFLVKMSKQINVFEDLVATVKAGETPYEAMLEMKFLAHRMYGVAGSVGLSELGDPLGKIEQRIQQAQDNREPPARLVVEVEQLVQQARSATLNS